MAVSRPNTRHAHAAPRASMLASFEVRSFRFQWPADLATSWAFEMETIILGWYVLVETRSVLMLTIFASLQHVGTLLSPMFGVMGDRVGHRSVLAAMRSIYASCAITLMALAYTGWLTPAYVLAVAAVMGLVRPSDIGVRAALVGNTMSSSQLMGAMSIQRTTQDSAKIAGALSGAGLVALLGMGPAYSVVASLYILSIVLTLKGGSVHRAKEIAPRPAIERVSPWRDLKAGLGYVWNTPLLLASMCFAFLLNLTAFPLMTGLMPVMAKQIYQTDQTGLSYLVASAATGALLGSIIMSRIGHMVRPARMLIGFSVCWYLALLLFTQTTHPAAGMPILLLAGLSQAMSQVPMAAMLLRNTDEHYRGRMMGIRMLAIYGNIPGLLIAGPLIAEFGYPLTAVFFCAFGILFTALIAARWHAQLWSKDAPANRR